MNLIIFGDSITNGYGTRGLSQTTILKDKIEACLPQLTVILRGVNGEDTRDGLARLEAIEAEKADCTLIFFGANDAARDHAITASEFATHLTTMVTRLSAERTVLLTPPYHNDAVFSLVRSNHLVERFREGTRSVAEKTGCQLIDVYTAMRTSSQPDTLLQADGLHLSECGYDLLSALIADKLGERGLAR